MIDKDIEWIKFICNDRVYFECGVELRNKLTDLTYREAQILLKSELEQNVFKKLNGRFRAHLHRLKSGKSTLTVDSYILRKLDAMKSNVGSDDYSDLLEYLLKPDGAYNQQVDQFHSAYTDNRINLDSSQKDFARFFQTLYPQHQTLVKVILESVFLQGVSAARTTRSINKLEALSSEYVDKLIYNLN